MRTRRIVAIALAVVSLPLLVLGLIDPLEGGLALLAAIALGVVIWALARVALPRLLWISLIVTVAVGALTLGLALLDNGQAADGGTGHNPILPLIGLLWLWRAGVVVVAVGAVIYIVRLFQAVRSTPVKADG